MAGVEDERPYLVPAVEHARHSAGRSEAVIAVAVLFVDARMGLQVRFSRTDV